jgi:hypothetical protein
MLFYRNTGYVPDFLRLKQIYFMKIAEGKEITIRNLVDFDFTY